MALHKKSERDGTVWLNSQRSEGPLFSSHAREGVDYERQIPRAPKVRRLLVLTAGPSDLLHLNKKGFHALTGVAIYPPPFGPAVSGNETVSVSKPSCARPN